MDTIQSRNESHSSNGLPEGGRVDDRAARVHDAAVDATDHVADQSATAQQSGPRPLPLSAPAATVSQGFAPGSSSSPSPLGAGGGFQPYSSAPAASTSNQSSQQTPFGPPTAFGAGAGWQPQSFARPLLPVGSYRFGPPTPFGRPAYAVSSTSSATMSALASPTTSYMPASDSFPTPTFPPAPVARASNHQQQSHLFRLPQEIRDIIYDILYTLDSHGNSKWTVGAIDEHNRVKNDHSRLAFTLTCRLANEEAGPVFYKRNHLEINGRHAVSRYRPGFPIRLSTTYHFIFETSSDRLKGIRRLSLSNRTIEMIQKDMADISGFSGLRELIVAVGHLPFLDVEHRTREQEKGWLQWALAPFQLLREFEMVWERWPYGGDSAAERWDELGVQSAIVWSWD